MKKDIKDSKDIELLVNTFYDKVKKDEVIGYFFTEVMKTNWDNHLQTMYKFWNNVLFFSGDYSGNPMEVHKKVNAKSPLENKHFLHWTKLFQETVDLLFEGDNAEQIKQRAASISTVMSLKISF